MMTRARLAGDVAAVWTRPLVLKVVFFVERDAASSAFRRRWLLHGTGSVLRVKLVEHRVNLTALLVCGPCSLLAGLSAGRHC